MMVLNRVEEKNLNLVMDIDEKLPSKAIGDVQKIRQAAANLLTNAVKYTKEGEVKFSVRMLEKRDDGFTVRFAVKDTGIGIKAQEMDKLFSAFDRLDFEKTRNIEGSGLGLAISQRFLALMGSEIKVVSEYGKGSEFSFLVKQKILDDTPIGPYKPLYLEKEGRSTKTRAASFTAPDARLLIVDDTPMNLQVLKGLLKGNQMNITTAESGEECIAIFEKEDFDMVFLDQRMPNLSGSETLQILKNKYPVKAKNTPIICLTANVLAGGRQQMIDSGFTDYLTKPVTLFEMEKMLLKYLPKDKINKAISEGKELSNPDAETVLSKIAVITDLNTEAGIDYCGDLEEYIEALKTYCASVTDKSGKMNGFLENSDIKDLSILAHSIKSTSRAIGANDLAALAEEIEKNAESFEKEVLEEKVSVFLRKYKSLGKEIEKAFR